MNHINLALVDDQELFRQGIVALMNRTAPIFIWNQREA
jgi:DNA-binding NarL/FixJ family response regulator